MSIPVSFIQELLSRVDIVEVVGRHVQLKKGGVNFMGLCPFHGEKSPSFSVSPTKQFYHCFGCGKHGDAIGFLIDHTGANFVEVVKDLAQEVGLTVPEDTRSPHEQAQHAQQRAQQATLTDLLEAAAKGYQAQLKGSPRAVDYLKHRGLTGQIAKTYGLGYAPEGWRYLSTLLPDYQSPLLTDSGLVIQHDSDHPPGSTGQDGKRYDRFRDRIMFPIRNVKGQCIGFGGRVLDKGEPKYLNSPETPVFSKGHELYGLFEARTAIRQAGHCLVTEGYMDVVALAQHGFGQAVATLGTACTADHIRLLFRFTDHVVFSFDGDAAGRRAAKKALDAALPWCTDTRSVKFLFLPPEHDPDSFVREEGADAFNQAIATALPLSAYMMQVSAENCDTQTPEGRALMASQAKPLWQKLPDGALKRQLLDSFADAIRLEVRDLHDLWQTSAPRGRRQPNPSPSGDTQAKPDRSSATITPNKRWQGSPGTDSSFPHRLARTSRGTAGLLQRPDRIARLVLQDTRLWDLLTVDDHNLLAHLPEPHGPFFAWLESQMHEHGHQPWASLQMALQGQTFKSWATQVMVSGMAFAPSDDESLPEDTQTELRDMLKRMHLERIKAETDELLAKGNPMGDDLTRFKALSEQRKALLAQL